jgi:beta-glucosidase
MNVGTRAGAEIAEIYARLPGIAQENFDRLVGWKCVQLATGQSQTLTVELDPLYLSVFDEGNDAWWLIPGEVQHHGGRLFAESPTQSEPLLKLI